MWPVWQIIVVATAAGTCLAVTATLATALLMRKQHHRILHQYGLSPIKRSGILKCDVEHEQYVMFDNTRGHLRRSFRMPPGSAEEAWADVLSQDDLSLQSRRSMEHSARVMPLTTSKSVVDPMRRLLRRDSKKSKFRRGMPLNLAMRSPLSAITEFTDSPHRSPCAVELPLHVTPRQTPKKDEIQPPVQWPLSIAKTRRPEVEVTLDAADSMTDFEDDDDDDDDDDDETQSAPQASCSSPPTFHWSTYNGQSPLVAPEHRAMRDATTNRFRASAFSLDTVSTSVLGSVCSPKVRSNTLQVGPDAFREFDFGLSPSTGSAEQLAPQPVRIGENLPRDGTHLINSPNPSPTADTPFKVADTQRQPLCLNEQAASPDFMGTLNRRSMFEITTSRDRSCEKLFHEDTGDEMSPLYRRSRLLVRPASAMAPRALQWDAVPLMRADNRTSVASNDSQRKGHRRQNCVRISGIPIAKSHINYAVSHDKSERPLRSAKRLAVDFSTSGSGTNVAVPRPLSIRRLPGNTNERPDSDVFFERSPATPPIYFRPHWPLVDTPSAAPSPYQRHDSPTLPSPAYTAAGLFPRKPSIKGPRSPPSAGVTKRTAQVQRKAGSVDLRRSIKLLRSMNSSALMLDPQQNKLYCDIGDDLGSTIIMGASPDMDADTHAPSPLASHPSTPKKNLTGSRSGVSIWEDASVRAESVEFELPSPTRRRALTTVSRAPGEDSLKPRPFELLDQNPDKPKSILKKNGADGTSAHGIGLGLKMSGHTWGTPSSLYDRQGFLED